MAKYIKIIKGRQRVVVNRNLPTNVTISDPRVEVLTVYDNFSKPKALYKLIVCAFPRITIATRCQFIFLLAAQIINDNWFRDTQCPRWCQIFTKTKPKPIKPLNIKLIYFLLTPKVPKSENKRRKTICNSTNGKF